MGRIKQIVIMKRDIEGPRYEVTNRDLVEYIEQTGGRVGLTDEQTREVSDD